MIPTNRRTLIIAFSDFQYLANSTTNADVCTKIVHSVIRTIQCHVQRSVNSSVYRSGAVAHQRGRGSLNVVALRASLSLSLSLRSCNVHREHNITLVTDAHYVKCIRRSYSAHDVRTTYTCTSAYLENRAPMRVRFTPSI